MRVNRDFRRVIASSIRSIGGRRLAAFALGGMVAVAAGAGLALAQGANDQQIRCMQLQQELVSASQGGGGSSDDLARLDQQIAQNDRVFQGTQAAMQDAGCFESFFIFGKALVRSPKCLKMNDRVEDARRQLAALQQQRAALSGGGGNKRRQAELQDAMVRSGCGGQVRAPAPKRGGGLLDFFGGGQEQEDEQQPETPIYRSIDPNGRYRSVCVRLCDGFFYPISFATYSSRLAQEQDQCQSSCAAPAELYVYRNPGQEIEQAISLNGSAYMDLPVALKYRKNYVTGCSCKQAEYNPTEIEAANKRAEAEAASQPAKGKGKAKVAVAKPAAAPAPATAAATPAQTGAQGNLDVTGSNQAASAAAPPPQAAPPAVPQAQKQPAPAKAAAVAPPPAPSQADAAASQSTVIKKVAKPAPPPAQ